MSPNNQIDAMNTETTLDQALAEAHRLSCLEVWGGNEATEALVRTSGLDVHTSIRVYEDHDAGGDVLYLTSCSSGRITRAILADVVGHGQAASETATSLRRMMAAAVDIYDQAKLVRTLNEEFSALQERGRFASAIVASYFLLTNKLTICNAGHPPPFYFSAREGRWQAWTARSIPETESPLHANLPLGLFGGVEYSLLEAKLDVGDKVLLYTDGVIEAWDDDERMFGLEGLEETLRSLGDSDADHLLREVTRAVEQWSADAASNDDISMMLIERNDLRPSLSDEILAPVRFVKRLATT